MFFFHIFFQLGKTPLSVSIQVTRQDEMFLFYFTNLKKQVIDFYMNSKRNCGYCLIMRYKPQYFSII